MSGVELTPPWGHRSNNRKPAALGTLTDTVAKRPERRRRANQVRFKPAETTATDSSLNQTL